MPILSEELSDAELGDERLNRPLGILADLVAERPDAGFPEALDDAELEAAYRFFGTDRVTPEAILAPHLRQCARRASEHEQVLVLHDTTEFEFGGRKKREGLGRLISPGRCCDGDLVAMSGRNVTGVNFKKVGCKDLF